MKPTTATVSILSLIASGSLAVDASVYDGKNIAPITETIANERVEVAQKGNIVEAKAPWKGEEGITVKYDMKEPSLAEKVRDRRKEEVIYEKVDFGDGGFKIDVLLTEKPSTNKFCYTIEGAENYDFFYQPPLTPEEIAEGAYRPPEIEGSYAVYHKTLKNHVIGQENYATGKVMHIPRPQVWELGNEENKVWADLSYDEKEGLCVTAPQDFIDNADYTNGVRIDPTFGYTTIGATGSSVIGEDTVRVSSSSPASSGILKSISVYSTANGGLIQDWKGVIYNDDSGDSLVGYGDTNSNVNTTSGGWFTSNMNNEVISSGTNYLIGWWFVCVNSSFWAANYDTVAGVSLLSDSLAFTSGAPNDPYQIDSSLSDRRYSIYATYDLFPNTIRINNGTIRINNGTLDI